MNDEKVYEQICENIRFTDEISFKLLGLVPLISGASIIAAVIKGDAQVSPGLFIFSIFGALLTLGIFRWELRNISTCKKLIRCAEVIEDSNSTVQVNARQFSVKLDSPGLFGDKLRIGKTEAEKFVYFVTVVAWLFLPWIGSNVVKADTTVAAGSELPELVYRVLILPIAIILVLSVFAKTDLQPKSD